MVMPYNKKNCAYIIECMTGDIQREFWRQAYEKWDLEHPERAQELYSSFETGATTLAAHEAAGQDVEKPKA